MTTHKKPPSTKKRVIKKAIIVLGMHRSGTSALAGTLGLLGCATPLTQLAAADDNPKGFFEASNVAKLNDSILKSAGSYWSDWRQINPAWFESTSADEFIVPAQEILAEEFGKKHLIALKDPRICRLAPFWIRAVKESGFTPHIIHTHRNPIEVAQSLKTRNGFDVPMGMILWLRHVLDAEVNTRGQLRCFTSYTQLLENGPSQIMHFQEALDLHFPTFSDIVAQKIDLFLNANLRHHQFPSSQVLDNPLYSEWIQDTFEIMQRWAANGELATDHAKLDDIRDRFNASIPAFSRLILANQDQLENLEKIVNQTKSTLEKRDAAIETATAAHALVIASTEKELSGLRATLEKHDETIEIAKASIKTHEGDLAQVKSALRQRQHEADQITKEATELEKALEVEKSNVLDITLKHQETFNKLARRDQDLGEMGRLCNELLTHKEKLAQADLEIKHLHNEYTRAASELQAVLKSTSWRALLPVRIMIDTIRGIFSR